MPLIIFLSICVNCSIARLMSQSLFLVNSHNSRPSFTNRDWQGIRSPIDAAMVGRVYLSPRSTPSSPLPARRRSSRRRRPSKKRGNRRRQSRHVFDDLWSYDDWFDFVDYSDMMDMSTTQEYKSTPVQNVYFFKKGMNTWSHFLSQSCAVIQQNRKNMQNSRKNTYKNKKIFSLSFLL